MNAPTDHAHLAPVIQPRAVPEALLAALAERFGGQLSTALAVREQHGRDESAFTAVPPPGWAASAALADAAQMPA